MQEFWFCANCKSMNRIDSEHCYKCRAPRARATLATAGVRKEGVVLTPGLDEDHRQVAWALMAGRHYISAWRLGYVTGALMILALACLLVGLGLSIVIAIASGATGDSTDSLPEITSAVGLLDLAALVLFVVTLITHSGFLCLTSMNAPALGCGTPRFGSLRSAVWSIEALLWVWWSIVCWNIWPYVLGRVSGLLCGPFAAIGKPKRLLQDLMDRLAVPGRSDSRLVAFWGAAWAMLVGMVYFVILGPLLLLATLFILILVIGLSGGTLTPAPPEQVGVFALLLSLFLLLIPIVAFAAWFFTLARITIEMSRRQRIRERWVSGGLRKAMAGASAGGMSGGASPGPVPGIGPQPGVPRRPAPAQPTYVVGQSAAPAPAARPTPQPGPRPINVPVPKYVVDQPGEAPVSWSRQVERVARPDPDVVPHDELPSAWLQAIERSTPAQAQQPAAGTGGQQAELSDRPVIQPSSANLSRYHVPQGGVGADRPAESQAPDPGSGEGA
jgi:hypothetical protein